MVEAQQQQQHRSVWDGGGVGTELSGLIMVGRCVGTGVAYDTRGSSARYCRLSAGLQVAHTHP